MDNEKVPVKRSSIDILCALALFLLFSVSSLILVTIGAGTYKGILGETSKNFNVKSSVHYITNKLHSYDQANLISIFEIDGVEVLELLEDENQSSYHTMIYCYDGYIHELLANTSVEFSLGDGEKILPVDSLEFELEGNLITIYATDADMNTTKAIVGLKSLDNDGRRT